MKLLNKLNINGMTLLKGYSLVAVSGFLFASYIDAKMFLNAKRNGTLKSVYEKYKTYGQFEEITTFEESGLDKKSDFDITIYGTYHNFDMNVFMWATWPVSFVYFSFACIIYKIIK